MPALELNSLRAISLNGLATDDEGKNMTLVMSRVQAPILQVTYRQPVGYDEPPPRRPSTLPPPGNYTLNLSLTSEIGEGRCGLVYDVNIHPSSSDVAANRFFDMPPLVAKVCIPNRTDDMLNEASCYDEMECIQGVGIPRCYGLFQCRAVVPALHKYRVAQHKEQLEEENDVLENRMLAEYSRQRRAFNLTNVPGPGPRKPKYTPFTRPPPTLCEDTISVLLLEKLGDHVPIGVPLPETLHEDLIGIYSDQAKLSVGHADIRWANVLAALPIDQGGLHGRASPFTHRTYNFRVIDFDQAMKWNYDEAYWREYYEGYVRRITKNIPWGRIVQYWE